MKNYDDFESRYHPIKNHFDEHAANEGTWFETFGKEEAFVRSTNPKKIWTIIEGDKSIWVVAGLHFVNRLGYLIAKSDWESDTEIYCFN